MKKVRIVHISDLHLSDHIFDDGVYTPKSSGHCYEKLTMLTKALNDIDWDLLLISGDISRKGQVGSFSFGKTWIEKTISCDLNRYVGLDLINKGKDYIIIPGNHDYYNKFCFQKSKENYNKYFDEIEANTVVTKRINDITVNVHLYDSSKLGSMANGSIKDKVKKNLKSDEIDIAMLHHHIVMPPNLSSIRLTEIDDIRNDANYLLSCGFNSIVFGHTHKYFQDFTSDNLLIKNFPIKRGKYRIIRNLLKTKLIDESNTVSYEREKTKSGQYPSFNSYMEYYYLKNVKKIDIKGPSEFRNVQSFYSELDKCKSKIQNIDLHKIFDRKLHVSMAQSACQKSENECGFNLFEYDLTNKVIMYKRYLIMENEYFEGKEYKHKF